LLTIVDFCIFRQATKTFKDCWKLFETLPRDGNFQFS
jgi:hypothetical protein